MRFWNRFRRSAGEQLLEKSCRLKLDFWRTEDGGILADFQLEGSLQDTEIGGEDSREFLLFLGQLVGRFTQQPPESEGGVK